MFFVVVFSQATFNTLSYSQVFVNNFFYFVFSSSFKLFTVFATAILDYHIFMFLSTVFLIYFDLFWLFTQLLYRSRDSLFILPLSYSNVNTYFKNISNCLKQNIQFTIISFYIHLSKQIKRAIPVIQLENRSFSYLTIYLQNLCTNDSCHAAKNNQNT